MGINIFIIKIIWMWTINKEVHKQFPNIWRKQGEQSECREENWINRNENKRVHPVHTVQRESATCQAQGACTEDLLGRLHSHPQLKAEGSTSRFPDEPHFLMALYMHFNLFIQVLETTHWQRPQLDMERKEAEWASLAYSLFFFFFFLVSGEQFQ